MMKRLVVIGISIFSITAATAQKTKQGTDTTKKTVVITSAYKPVLKPVAKINFSSASTVTDTSKPALLTYRVPAQNLFFTYEPASLKPLALSIDSTFELANSNYVKLGYGNYSTPYAEAGLSYGNGSNSLVTLHGKHFSQKGSLPFQQYSKLGLDVSGLYSTGANVEWRGKIGYDRSTQYYYGFRPEDLKYTKDSLKQRYSDLGLMVGVRNKEMNSLGISYNPSLALNLFSDNRSGSETDFVLNAPLAKKITDDISARIGVKADLTSYKPGFATKVSNNLFFVYPGITLKRSNFTLNAGVTPAWDNKATNVLPDVTAVVKLADEKFVIQAGWVGTFQKNSYRSLSAFNPFIAQPTTLINTRLIEQFAGFKGSAGSHFTYDARLSVVNYKNAALFINDLVDGKTFSTVYEPSMRAVKISGEVGYTVQEKFSLLGGAMINKYANLKENEKAWGLLPMEITGALRWQVLKDLQFKSDLFFWQGAPYKTKNETGTNKGAFDLSAGAELTVAPKFNVWLQLNNIFNNKYERWNQYQVVGLNVLGGIVYSF